MKERNKKPTKKKETQEERSFRCEKENKTKKEMNKGGKTKRVEQTYNEDTTKIEQTDIQPFTIWAHAPESVPCRRKWTFGNRQKQTLPREGDPEVETVERVRSAGVAR